ncbi:hypothetical protein [Parafrankia sp. EUN1f]|uniref:hypothetical protein n=1 Tax=Parafrankia sp. EUN1f TaxID=102897 RepID=UPI0001C456F9|nr:hypothetical protein [Parafrankia sp. EUN1f]EFC78785.1 hypothetical protein FrEUN1fDRAFT_8092 [Parafrankia sp. EUN1f]
MQVEERTDQGQMGVEERSDGLVLLVRRAALAEADLRALRAVLAPVSGRLVGPPYTSRRRS